MDTARSILEVAYKLFVEKGYEATNIREICKEVGVGMPTIYYHYLSKENLLYKAVDEYSLSYLEHYESQQIINDKVNAEVKLFTLFKEDVKYVGENKTLFRFHVRYKFFPPKELQEQMEKKMKMYWEKKSSIILQIIEEGIKDRIFQNCNQDNFLNAYRKFCFDNMVGAVFFDEKFDDDKFKAYWKAFLEFNI